MSLVKPILDFKKALRFNCNVRSELITISEAAEDSMDNMAWKGCYYLQAIYFTWRSMGRYSPL